MSSETRSRLVDAGWSITCDRYVGIDLTGGAKREERFCTWRGAKGADEVVVKSKLGDDHAALRELYMAAKAIDPDLRQIAMEAGSGAWVFDLSQAESNLDQ